MSKDAQICLFSATMPPEVLELTKCFYDTTTINFSKK